MNNLKFSSVILLISAVSGCSFFKERPEIKGSDASFVKEVRKIGNSMPTEVELVEDQPYMKSAQTSPVDSSPVSAAEPHLNDVAETVMSDDVGEETVMSGPAVGSLRKSHRRPTADGAVKMQTAGSGGGSYRVSSGDTLMKIAFDHYGDITKWRAIYDLNVSSIKQYNSIYPGMVLTLGNEDFVVIERNGKPYLIRRNDTLMSISNLLYGRISDWKMLWQNNRQLIRDPNKIYAGFKLYYLPKSATLNE